MKYEPNTRRSTQPAGRIGPLPPGGESLTSRRQNGSRNKRNCRTAGSHNHICSYPRRRNPRVAVENYEAGYEKDEMIRQLRQYYPIEIFKWDTPSPRGQASEDYPTDEEIEQLWDSCQTPENVRHHCRAVCDEAMEICAKLKEAGVPLSQGSFEPRPTTHVQDRW